MLIMLPMLFASTLKLNFVDLEQKEIDNSTTRLVIVYDIVVVSMECMCVKLLQKLQ